MPAPALYAPLANAMLDLLQSEGYTWVQFHTGEPGAAGTSNIAGESTRVEVEWDTATGGSVEITTELEITTVAASEDWTHWTAWTLASGGVVGISGLVTASAVTVGDNVTIAPESVSVTFTLAT